MGTVININKMTPPPPPPPPAEVTSVTLTLTRREVEVLRALFGAVINDRLAPNEETKLVGRLYDTLTNGELEAALPSTYKMSVASSRGEPINSYVIKVR